MTLKWAQWLPKGGQKESQPMQLSKSEQDREIGRQRETQRERRAIEAASVVAAIVLACLAVCPLSLSKSSAVTCR